MRPQTVIQQMFLCSICPISTLYLSYSVVEFGISNLCYLLVTSLVVVVVSFDSLIV